MIYQWLQMLWEGNPIAWALFGSGIVLIVLVIMLVVLWWKMPGPAKRLLLNNVRGRYPIIANCYDNQHTKLQTPRIFGEGLFYNRKQGFHFAPRLTTEAADELSNVERETVTKAFRLDGTNSAFYLAYSGKGTVVNPEIQALMEHEELVQDNNEKVVVPKKVLIDVLRKMDDKMVTIKPLWVSQFLDPRKIKEYIPKAFTKSALRSMEHQVREDENNKKGTATNPLIVMVLVAVVLQVIGLLKLFNAF